MDRQLDPVGSSCYRRNYQREKLTFIYNDEIERFLVMRTLEGVKIKEWTYNNLRGSCYCHRHDAKYRIGKGLRA